MVNLATTSSVISLEAPPVKVGVFFESLCPDCRDFFLNQVAPAISEVSSITQLVLIPYGNAKYTIINSTSEHPDIKFTCQHGPEECVGNILEVGFCSIIVYYCW